MVSITQFERSVIETNVCFLCGFCSDLGLIDDTLHITISIHGTLVRFPTIAASLSLTISACRFANYGFFFFSILFIKQKYVTILTIVHLDKCSCIGH